MNRFIKEKIAIIKKGYIDDPNRILQDSRKEIAEIEGYHGRELLELIQNAVDEMGSTSDRHILIEITGSKLKVCNNGSIFTEDGITSLMYSNLSPKYKQFKYIGNKGTGFRSVLNWADCIHVFSGELSIEFSTESAIDFFNELLKNENVKKYYFDHPDLQVAKLVAPKIILPLEEKEYDTIVEMNVKDEMLPNVCEQLEKLDATTILFLDKLDVLTIKHNDEKKITARRQ